MPLGGSVTRGVGSSHGAGYRKPLLQLLKDQGINSCMVGSRKDGSIPNNEHEGWRGFRIDEIEKKAKKSVKRLSPDIFMVNAGSNDCIQVFNTAEAGRRMSQMLDYLWLACPQSTILLSTLIPNADPQVDSVVRDLNDQFHALTEKNKDEKKKILLVDMHSSEGPEAHELVDGIHPDDGGYEKMAELWVRGIKETIEKGFIDY
ncbi:carbohydrate esterase family 3 protein [Penicillium cosmopolitanum]|uniref:Carbohydrate esterase family 3 protein n=1 Tax=Penicillium cosmopolitanum TaxID=1131564 RepID=A0A9X0B4N7_9EURO|nr:carbohydrate esterase family 3 protein [Penicillium cosmopolitanum]KAJ5388039.1 carbohydrate esterase family 3 protein [Penicillium cosmopolitanum]